jgi:hypothetical protein
MARFLALVLALFAASATVASAVTVVDLGTAANYAILTKAGISTVASVITGNIAVSPAAGTYMTGFSLTKGTGATYSTSDQLTGLGRAYAPTDDEPTPTHLTTAVGDMEIAYADAAQRATTQEVNLKDGNIGGETLESGVYKFTVDININSDITFSGGTGDVFILQTSGALKLSGGKKVILTGEAQAKNIFWQVVGPVTVETNAEMQGILLGSTSVDFKTGSSLKGRVLAQTACSLDQATITQP